MNSIDKTTLHRKKQLLRFLKENNCYKEFIKNFIQFESKGYFKNKLDIDDLVSRVITYKSCSESEINDAFRWKDTIQGENFWRTIDDKWYILNYYITHK